MKLFTKKDKRTTLEKAIDKVLTKMDTLEPDTEEYGKANENLAKLYEAKSIQAKSGYSKDTILVVTGNLLGILLILNFERMGIITTKALSMIIKSRV